MRRYTVPACVFGDINLLRALGRAGIPCVSISPPGSTESCSRYAVETIPVEHQQILYNPNLVRTSLIDFAQRQHQSGPHEKPVLFYEEDHHTSFISTYRDDLARFYKFVLADDDLLDNLSDKAKFASMAKQLDFPVPHTCLLSASNHPSSPVDLGMRFPIVLKPYPHRTWWWHSSAKAIAVQSEAEFAAKWDDLRGMQLIAQEMIPGPESAIVSYHCYVRHDGEHAPAIIADFTGKKLRTWPTEMGHSTALQTTKDKEVLTLGRELTRRLIEHKNTRGWGNGFIAKFDFKRDRAGKLWLLEINPRFTLWHYLGAVAGINIPELVYCDLLGLRYTGERYGERYRFKPNATWCRIPTDAKAARASRQSLVAWLWYALRADASLLDWRDPQPLIQTVRSYIPWPKITKRMP